MPGSIGLAIGKSLFLSGTKPQRVIRHESCTKVHVNQPPQTLESCSRKTPKVNFNRPPPIFLKSWNRHRLQHGEVNCSGYRQVYVFMDKFWQHQQKP